MLAYRLVQARALAQPEFHELPEPHAGLGEIVVEVGGSVPFDFFKVPPGAQLVTSLNGGSVALQEVVDMAALGRLKILVDRYPLTTAKQAYDDFQHGRLVGRAVLIPEELKGSNRKNDVVALGDGKHGHVRFVFRKE